MTSYDLQQWMEHPDQLNRETLYEIRTLLARYPYFQSLRLLYLKNLYLLHDITFGPELRKAALYVADRRSLFYLIEGEKYAIQKAEKKKNLSGEEDEEPGLDRTISLIDAFLSTIPEESENAIGFDYATDYTTYLENDMPVGDEQPATDAPRLKGQDLIDGFIARNDAESLWVKKQMLAAEPAAVEPIPAAPEELIAQEPEQPDEDETDVPDEEIDSTTDPETEQIEVETFVGEEDEDEEEYYNEEEDEEPQSLVATSEGGGRRRPSVVIEAARAAGVMMESIPQDEAAEATHDDPVLEDEDDEEGCFTETLAKIYIKQQRYEKALEIIEKLNLNYPKKNAYFADQIRFLKKLIINAKSK